MDWQPIEDAKKKPHSTMLRVYSYKPEYEKRHGVGRQTHSRHTTFDYPFGSRVCDLFMDIPKPEEFI